MRFSQEDAQCAYGNEPTKPILDLLHLCFAEMEGRIDPPSSFHRLNEAKIEQQIVEQVVILIHKNRKPIACMFTTETSNHLYLGKIAIHASYRGNGALAAMLATATSLAKSLNIPKLRLQTRIELTKNHVIFAHYGFVKTATGTHAGFSQPTEITMEKMI